MNGAGKSNLIKSLELFQKLSFEKKYRLGLKILES